jgi:hypothetical protein
VTWANDVVRCPCPVRPLTDWQGGRHGASSWRRTTALGRYHGRGVRLLEPQVALLRKTRSETLIPAICQPGTDAHADGDLMRLVMAWRRRRRARQAADPLLTPDLERAPARATLAYYNQVGDPSH